jgi:PKD repeat protein
LSDATVADPVFTPTAAGTYTFRVTAVNKDQCTKTESITIKVIDVRCGDAKKVAQVLVCVDGVAECVAPQAVHRLLTQAKGKLGACGTTAAGRVSAEDREDVSGAQVSAWPNPFSRSVTIDIVPESSGYATYEVSSPQGVLVRRLFAGPVESGRLLRLELDGSGLPSGVYVGRFISEGNVHTLKLILKK